ncbi:MAG: LapA family protein [Leptospirillia bacterium]
MADLERRIRTYFGVALLVLLVVFAAQNTTIVTVRLLFWKVEMSRALMVLAVYLAGAITGVVVWGIRRHPR